MRWLKRILVGTVALVAVAAIGATAWYQLVYKPPRYSPADPLALAALKNDAAVTVTRESGFIVMRRRSAPAATGLIFYPGGQCAPEGYAEPLRGIAMAGYTVVLVPMPLELAILAPDRADDVMAAFPDIRRWVIAGHSLGGAMAGQYVFEHPGRVQGLLLWDAYLDPRHDLSASALPVRQLHRLEADGRTPEVYAKAAHLLPPQAQIVTLPGASHMNYGRFILAERFSRQPASITQATLPIGEQHARIAAASIEFLAGVDNG